MASTALCTPRCCSSWGRSPHCAASSSSAGERWEGGRRRSGVCTRPCVAHLLHSPRRMHSWHHQRPWQHLPCVRAFPSHRRDVRASASASRPRDLTGGDGDEGFVGPRTPSSSARVKTLKPPPSQGGAPEGPSETPRGSRPTPTPTPTPTSATVSTSAGPPASTSSGGGPVKRRRGRPKGSRKVTGAPVPGDALGVASLLWRLASEDEETLGTARIKPHGLEAVVPSNAGRPRRKTKKKTNTSDGRRAGGGAVGDDAAKSPDGGGGEADDGEANAAGTLDGGRLDDDDEDDPVVPLYQRRRDPRPDPPPEELKRRATRHSGVARSRETRKRIAASARERWRAAREGATARRTAQVAATVHALKLEATLREGRNSDGATLHAKETRAGATEGAADASEDEEGHAAAAAASSAPRTSEDASLAPRAAPADAPTSQTKNPPRNVDEARQVAFNPSAPWEALAVGAGGADASSDRAAAFAALLTGGSGISSDISSGSGSVARFIASSSSDLNASGSFDDEDDDDELRATKRKMRAQLAALSRRRAELIGNGTPSMSRVTVARFSEDLRRYKRLREDLEEWSNAFAEKHGRRPMVKDVERTGIDFLIANFKEYVAMRDKLMSQTPYLRGQMEDIAKDTLPTPRAAGNRARVENARRTRTPSAYGSALKWPGVSRPGGGGEGMVAAEWATKRGVGMRRMVKGSGGNHKNTAAQPPPPPPPPEPPERKATGRNGKRGRGRGRGR